jgi:hypothetical protein
VPNRMLISVCLERNSNSAAEAHDKRCEAERAAGPVTKVRPVDGVRADRWNDAHMWRHHHLEIEAEDGADR